MPQFDLEPATATCSAVKFGPAKFSGEAFGVVAPAPVHAGFEPVSHGVRTILLVEDEIFVRDVVGEILSSAGYRVLKAKLPRKLFAPCTASAKESICCSPMWYCPTATAATWLPSSRCFAAAFEPSSSRATRKMP